MAVRAQGLVGSQQGGLCNPYEAEKGNAGGPRCVRVSVFCPVQDVREVVWPTGHTLVWLWWKGVPEVSKQDNSVWCICWALEDPVRSRVLPVAVRAQGLVGSQQGGGAWVRQCQGGVCQCRPGGGVAITGRWSTTSQRVTEVVVIGGINVRRY